MYSIGEFSRITGLTVKTLRFYHEQNILPPARVDGETGYRHYAANQIETAHVIVELRRLDFSIKLIAEILANYNDEADILDFLVRQQQTIAEKQQHFQQIGEALDGIISREQEARARMQTASFEVEEKTVEPMLIAGIRMKGRYADCGKAFGKLGRKMGRHMCGKPLLLIYDAEYKEDDADYEVCMPVRKGKETDEISIRELPGGRCITLLYRGPYPDIGTAYAKILGEVKGRGCEIDLPTREVYIKGPGMIFKGNPTKYLTEIQMLIRE